MPREGRMAMLADARALHAVAAQRAPGFSARVRPSLVKALRGKKTFYLNYVIRSQNGRRDTPGYGSFDEASTFYIVYTSAASARSCEPTTEKKGMLYAVVGDSNSYQ